MSEPFKTTAIGWLATAVMAAGATEHPGQSSEFIQPVAEEILDTAISHCKQGEFTSAHTLLRALQLQLDPPPAIHQLISSLINGGCEAQWIAPSHWEMRTTLGYDTNINQGISRSTLTVGDALTGLELTLDDSYRPVASGYAEVMVGHSQPIKPGGPTLQVTAGARSHAASNARPYDLAHLGTALTHTAPVQGQPVELLGEVTKLWLGGRMYHTAFAATAQTSLLPHHVSSPKLAISAHTFRYHTQPQQNSNQMHIGITYPLHSSQRHSLFMGATGMVDHALGQRAGGHRTGSSIYAVGATSLPPWRIVVRMDIAYWRSQQHFFPGLIDQERSNRLMHLALKAEYPLTPRRGIQLDLQTRRSHDNIALYTYKSTHIGISWATRF